MPATGMKFETLRFQTTAVKDLAPLKNIRSFRTAISKTPKTSQYFREVATLERWNGVPAKDMPLQAIECKVTTAWDNGLDVSEADENQRQAGDRGVEVTDRITSGWATLFCRCIAWLLLIVFPLRVYAQPKAKLDPKWYERVAILPADEQVRAVTAKMTELNIGFNVPLQHKIEDGAVVEVTFSSDYVSNLAPIRAFAKLKKLDCSGSNKIADLSPLRGLKLTEFRCNKTPLLSDLGPLKGMPLVVIEADSSAVASLTPLEKMTTLRELKLNYARKITDLKPLEGLPLTVLGVSDAAGVRDLSPLRGMSLTHLNVDGSNVADLSPLKAMQLENLYLLGTKVTNFAVIKSMPIKSMSLPRVSEAELKDLFKSMPIENLAIHDAVGLTDLSIFAGKKLKTLHVAGGQFTDLKALEGMPIWSLYLDNCPRLADASLANKMPLKSLVLRGSAIKELPSLAHMKLTRLDVSGCRNLKSIKAVEGATIDEMSIESTAVADLTPIASVKAMTEFYCRKTLVKDFSALKSSTVIRLWCDIKGPKDIAALKEVKTLKRINDKPVAEVLK